MSIYYVFKELKKDFKRELSSELKCKKVEKDNIGSNSKVREKLKKTYFT